MRRCRPKSASPPQCRFACRQMQLPQRNIELRIGNWRRGPAFRWCICALRMNAATSGASSRSGVAQARRRRLVEQIRAAEVQADVLVGVSRPADVLQRLAVAHRDVDALEVDPAQAVPRATPRSCKRRLQRKGPHDASYGPHVLESVPIRTRTWPRPGTCAPAGCGSDRRNHGPGSGPPGS